MAPKRPALVVAMLSCHMPHKHTPGIEPMSIANMKENRVSAVAVRCEAPGCYHHVSIPVAKLYELGFTDADAVVDIGWKLKCSKCGRKGATTQPDWSTRANRFEGA